MSLVNCFGKIKGFSESEKLELLKAAADLRSAEGIDARESEIRAVQAALDGASNDLTEIEEAIRGEKPDLAPVKAVSPALPEQKGGAIVKTEGDDNERTGTSQQGPQALGGMASGEDRGTEGGGDIRGGNDGGRADGAGKDRPTDGKRLPGTRSGRSGSQGVRPPAAGEGGAKPGSRGKRSGIPKDDGSDLFSGQPEGLSSTPAEPTAPQVPAAPNISVGNFVITDDVRLGQGGEAEKFRDNLAAIRILKAIERDNRRATPEEKNALARYVGWGGLANAFSDREGTFKDGWEDRGKELADLLSPAELAAARRSTRNAHYTSQAVVRAMWSAVERLGYRGGLALESSVGSGNFIGLMPESLRGDTRFMAVEYDSLTARLAQALYPQETVLHSGFQKVPMPDGAFDLDIGNPPFGSESLRFQHKPEFNRSSIHNQFFLAGLDALKPGGLQIKVVSRYLLDAKDSTNRKMMAARGRLIGVIRLPDSTFKENARTDVVTDIVIFQRLTAAEEAGMNEAIEASGRREKDPEKERARQAKAARLPSWVETTTIPDPLGGEPMTVNQYFADHPEMVVGRLERSGKMQFETDEAGNKVGGVNVKLESGQDLAELLEKAINRLPKGVMDRSQDVINASLERYTSMAEALKIAVSGQEAGHIEINSDGALTQVLERETPEGDFELSRRVLTAESPWSPQLLMDARGRWYRVELQKDSSGKQMKVPDALGKPTKRNLTKRTVYEKDSDVPASLRMGQSRYDRLKMLSKLRDLLKGQLILESEDAPAEKIELNRDRLAQAYNTFVDRHEFINSPKNSALVSDMPDGALMQALELFYRKEISAAKAARTGDKPRKASAMPAPILSKRVLVPYSPRDRADSPSDALAITTAESGKVDIARVAQLLGMSEEEAGKSLQSGDKPLAFFDPESEAWVTANEYLSGQVKRKLQAARAQGLDTNIKALEKVQPEPWGAESVTVHLGSAWVPEKVYADFIAKLTGSPATVRFSSVTNSYAVTAEREAGSVKNWSTDRMTAGQLVSDLLNSKAIKVYDTDRDGKRHLNEEQTALAQLKGREIATEFGDWVFADGDRRQSLVELFNDKFNTRVIRQHDGSHLTLPGKVPDQILSMRRHQKNAIWRGISERFMLLDHVVGAGKTFTAIARAMERRRMGLSKKPMIVVPNHLVDQFAADTYRLYPGAKVLAAGKGDLERSRRRKAFAKIATGDWDIVIVPHSSFMFIDISPETEERFLSEELRIAEQAIADAQEQAEEDGHTGHRKPFNVKEAERLAETIQKRIDQLKGRNRDKLLTFEQMGVDDLTVDEAHEFKNLFYSSRLTGVRGMGNKTGSQKAFDLYNKVRVLRESPTGTVTFMTGTPISNSAVEMFTMMRYLAADDLRDLGLEHFDAWRTQFVEADARFEPTESGRLKEVTRLGRTWSNMRSLMDLYYSFTDAVSQEDIQKWYREDNNGEEFPIPKVKGGDRQRVVVKPTEAQQGFLDTILQGFDNLPNEPDPYERNKERLRLMDQARKVSLDARAVNRFSTSTEPDGKLQKVSEQIKRIYDRWTPDLGTQLVFLDRSVPSSKSDNKVLKEYDDLVSRREAALADNDEDGYRKLSDSLERFEANEMEELRAAQGGGWNAYTQIKQNLVAMGIPASEIRFVQEANNDEQKKALFDAVNEGSVRVLIGSTQRMGAGTNVQERLVGLHHVDVGWKPSDIEQREGRIIRQGNSLLEKHGDEFEIEILAYATERTIDAKMWDLNSTKLRTINGIRKYDGAFTMDFEDEEAVGMAEMAALASGDPLLLERVKLMSQIDRMDLMRRAHSRKLFGVQDAIRRAERAIEENPNRIEQLEMAAKTLKPLIDKVDAAAKDRSVMVEGKRYETLFSAMQAMTEAVKSQQGGNENAKYSVKIDDARHTNKAALEDAILGALGDDSTFEVDILGATYLSRTAAGRALVDALAVDTVGKEGKTVALGSMFGLPLEGDVSKMPSGKYEVSLSLSDETGRTLSSGFAIVDAMTTNTAKGLLSQVSNGAREIASPEAKIAVAQGEIDSAEKDLPKLREQASAPFPQQAELDDAIRRLEVVVGQLSDKPEPAAAPEAGDFSRESGLPPSTERGTLRNDKQAQTDLAYIEGAIAAMAGVQRVPGGLFRPVRLPLDSALQDIARAFGKRVLGVRIDKDKSDSDFLTGWQGVAVPGSQAIGIVEGAPRPHLNILFHEFAHKFAKEDPKAFAELIDAIRPYVKQGEYGSRFAKNKDYANLTHAKIREEFVGEVFSDGASSSVFWDAIARHSPELLRKVIDAVRALVNRAKKVLGYKNKTEKYLTDFDAVMAIAGRAVARHYENRRGDGDGEGFSRTTAAPFYSELERGIQKVGMKAGPAKAWKDYIKSQIGKGVKADEIEAVGINEWLDVMGKEAPVYEPGFGIVEQWRLKSKPGGAWEQVDHLGYYFPTEAEARAKMAELTPNEVDDHAFEARLAVKPEDGLDFGKRGTPKITKDEVMSFLAQNGVRVEEAMLGGEVPPAAVEKINQWLKDTYGEADENATVTDADITAALRGDETAVGAMEEAGVPSELMQPIYDNINSGASKFGGYQLPGGNNYRELLLTLPEKRSSKLPAGYEIVPIETGGYAVQDRHGEQWAMGRSADEALTEYLTGNPFSSSESSGNFRSSHFDQPNILAHIRFNERTDADGKRVLFVEEIQSDWAQKGRSEGFKKTTVSDEDIARFTAEGWDMQQDVFDPSKPSADPANRAFRARLNLSAQVGPKAKTERGAWLALAQQQASIPSAPFVTKTEAWTALVLKRMIRYAAENGFDSVAWTTGAQQVERYTSALRKAVDVIEWEKTKDGIQLVGYKTGEKTKKGFVDAWTQTQANDVFKRNDNLGFDTRGEAQRAILSHPDWEARWGDMPAEDLQVLRELYAQNAGKAKRAKVVDTTEKESALSDAIGKVMAERIIADPNQSGTIEGENITIDKTGMAGYYGKIVPSVANGILKKLGGGKVGEVSVSHGDRTVNGYVESDGQDWYVRQDGRNVRGPYASGAEAEEAISNRTTQPGFTITPEMREKALAGQPLFSREPIAGGAQLRDLLERYEGSGEIETVSDLADAAETLADETGNQELADLVRDYRSDVREDFERYAGRGDIEGYEGALISGIRSLIEPKFSREPSIAGSQTTGNAASWDSPEPSKLDNLVYVLQDKHVDTRRVLEAIKKNASVADAQDVRLQEELYHGRTAKQVDDFLASELKPLLTEMAARKVTMADLEEYLHARHAEERNIQIAKVNPNMPDGGSGMDTADAQAYLSGLTPAKQRAYEALAKRVDAINAKTRQTWVDYGLTAQRDVDAMQNAYQHYVPLHREDMDGGPGIGQGFSVRGPATKRATGSKRAVVDIIANIAMQREKAIVRGEKNRVSTALVGLAEANPNPDFWSVDQPPKIKFIDDATGLVREAIDPLFRSRDNVVMARIPDENGDIVEHSVEFNESDERAMRMAMALKNLDMDDLGAVLGMSAKITRYFASVNTQYNPVFGVVNLVRDFQGALLNLTSTELAGKQAEVSKHTLSALKGIYLDARSIRDGKPATSKWAQLWEEFQDVGGKTGYRDMFRTSKDRGEAIEREISRVSEGKAKQFGRAVFDWLSDYNTAGENAVRLAAYKVGIDNGMTKERAASLAKNLTVNFNRKGQIATQAGALYAFFNASMQGTARMIEALNGPMGRKIVAGGLTLGAVQALALAAAGFDDDEPPDFVRERNVIIPIGGKKYITIPMPLGLHAIPNISRVATEFALSGFRDPGKRVAQLAGVLAEAFNPIGNAGVSLQTIAPTAIDPLAALAENRDWTGKPIARENMNGLSPTPGHTRAKDTASIFSKELSKGLNWMSGGTNYKPGLFSPTPDQIDYLIGQASGGIGREAMKVEQAVSSAFTGEDLPTYKRPLLGRFYGDSADMSSQASAFYTNLKALNEHEAEIKGRRKHGEPLGDYFKENPEARLFQMGNRYERMVSQLRKRKRDLVEKDASADQIKAVDLQINAQMTRLNEQVKRTREASR